MLFRFFDLFSQYYSQPAPQTSDHPCFARMPHLRCFCLWLCVEFLLRRHDESEPDFKFAVNSNLCKHFRSLKCLLILKKVL